MSDRIPRPGAGWLNSGPLQVVNCPCGHEHTDSLVRRLFVVPDAEDGVFTLGNPISQTGCERDPCVRVDCARKFRISAEIRG